MGGIVECTFTALNLDGSVINVVTFTRMISHSICTDVMDSGD